MSEKQFLNYYFKLVSEVSKSIEVDELSKIIYGLNLVRKNKGRVFLLGVGGSAANCSHMVNDLRKLCLIEAYSPCDNFSEFSARVNDEGWDSAFLEWLKVSRLSQKDALFILSVGGGNKKKKISVNLIEAMNYAKSKKSKIFGIIGKKEGYAKEIGNSVLLIPSIDDKLITPLCEGFQAVVWHAIVSSSLLQKNKTKW